jgi:hypothetical protein
MEGCFDFDRENESRPGRLNIMINRPKLNAR